MPNEGLAARPNAEAWEQLTKPFSTFLDHAEEAGRALEASTRGISVLVGMPRVMEALQAVKEPPDAGEKDDAPERLRHARELADFAKGQVDKGFPLLYGQALVSLWGELEALVEDFLVVWFQNTPDALRIEQVARLKVPLAQFETLDAEERIRLLVHELEDNLRATFRAGVVRFEALLSVIGMSGDVDPQVKRDLYEMNHVRNVIVHKASTADRRFAEACPWLGVKPGTPLKVTAADWVRYSGAVHSYNLNLINRLRVACGKKPYVTNEKAAEPSAPTKDIESPPSAR